MSVTYYQFSPILSILFFVFLINFTLDKKNYRRNMEHKQFRAYSA